MCDELKYARESLRSIDSYTLSRRLGFKAGMAHILNPKYERHLLDAELNPQTSAEKRRIRKRVQFRLQRCFRLIRNEGFFLDHHLLMNAVYIWLRRSNEVLQNLLPAHYDVHCKTNGFTEGAPVPDAKLTIPYDRGAMILFVETDRGTEPVATLREKFGSYEEIIWEHPSLLLFVQQELKKSPQALLKVAEKAGIGGRFLVTSFSDFRHLNAYRDSLWWGLPGGCPSLLEAMRRIVTTFQKETA